MIKSTLFFTVFTVLFFPFLLSLFLKNIPNDIQASLEGTQVIYKKALVLQSFTSEMNNLSGIGTSIKNPNFRNRKDLIFNLYSEDNILQRTVTLNGFNIPDGDFIKIIFEPINNSKDKKYAIEFLAPDAESEEALEIFLTSQKPSWIGDLYINSNRSDTKLPFVTYHKPSNILSVPIGIFSHWTIRLFLDLPFALFYSFLVGGIGVYTLWNNRN